jgi:molybdopterin converting factor subunit 1
MKTSVHFFATYREQVGSKDLDITLDSGSTVADLLYTLENRYPGLRLDLRPTLVAVNAEYASPDYVLREGDQVALIPPVSGGSHVRITTNPLDPRSVTFQVRDENNGAVVVFEGVTRRAAYGKEVQYLEYEAFVPMAEKELARIIEDIRQEFGINDIAVEHRIGRVDIGETSLIVAIGSRHRRESLAAITATVDRIKQTVPIWKKEFFADGAIWVESEEDRNQSHKD